MSHTESIEKNRIRFLNLFNLSNGVEHITLIVTYNIIFISQQQYVEQEPEVFKTGHLFEVIL